MGYAITCWVLSAVILAVFIGWTLLRGRRLSAQVPADQRRWM